MRIPRYQHSFLGRGFTLIEMMVVLIIIGIGVAAVTLSVGDGARPQEMKASSRQLYSAMNLALEDAVFLNRQIGLRFDFASQKDEVAYSYQWLYYDAEKRQWQELPVEGFEKTDLPAYLQLELEVEGQPVLIGSNRKEDALLVVEEDKDDEKDKDKAGKKAQPSPDLYFLSSGEMQAFKLVLSDRDSPERQYIISGDVLGQMTFKQPNEDEQ